MSPDPGNISAIFHMDDPQAWNGYAYARNNPLKYSDPSGTNYTICDRNGQNCSYVTPEQFSQIKSDAEVSGETWASIGNGMTGTITLQDGSSGGTLISDGKDLR
jgi:hypothetical protein